MDKKRALLMNALVIAAILLLSLAALAVSELMPKRITPNAGPLEMEFEPAVTTQGRADVPSACRDWMISAFKEVEG